MAESTVRDRRERVRFSHPRLNIMFNQKGQIHIIVLVLSVIAFILYVNFSDGSFFKKFFSPSASPAKSTPSKGGRISTPAPPVTPTQPASTPEIPDILPPQRFDPQPIGSLPAGTRTITLSLETDEKATCKHSDTSGVYYDSMQGKFDQANSTSHTVLITTLSEGGKYKYYVKCSDEKDNKNTDDFIISFEVKLPEDKTPPVLSNPSHQGDILPAGTREAVISISTDEPASCKYSIDGGKPYSSMSGSFSYYDQTKKFHTKSITKLENGKAYDFFVRCKDLAGNANTGDVLIRFSVGQ